MYKDPTCKKKHFFPNPFKTTYVYYSSTRYHSRYFVKVGHKTTYAAIKKSSFFSPYHVIVRPIKIMKDLCKAST